MDSRSLPFPSLLYRWNIYTYRARVSMRARRVPEREPCNTYAPIDRDRTIDRVHAFRRRTCAFLSRASALTSSLSAAFILSLFQGKSYARRGEIVRTDFDLHRRPENTSGRLGRTTPRRRTTIPPRCRPTRTATATEGGARRCPAPRCSAASQLYASVLASTCR